MMMILIVRGEIEIVATNADRRIFVHGCRPFRPRL